MNLWAVFILAKNQDKNIKMIKSPLVEMLMNSAFRIPVPRPKEPGT